MQYDDRFMVDAAKEISELADAASNASFSFDIQPDFNPIPAVLLCRWIEATKNLDSTNPADFLLVSEARSQINDLVLRHAINNCQVTIYINGNPVTGGSFKRNSIDASWSVFPIFDELPAVYMHLVNLVTTWLSKKLVLPLAKAATVAKKASKA